MKKLIIRIALLLVYLPTTAFGPFTDFVSVIWWDTLVALAFALAAIYLTGRAYFFVPITVAIVTVSMLFVTLCAIGMTVFNTWSNSATHVVHNLIHLNPYYTLYLFLPTVITILFVRLVGRKLVPNNSSKRTRVPRAA